MQPQRSCRYFHLDGNCLRIKLLFVLKLFLLFPVDHGVTSTSHVSESTNESTRIQPLTNHRSQNCQTEHPSKDKLAHAKDMQLKFWRIKAANK